MLVVELPKVAAHLPNTSTFHVSLRPPHIPPATDRSAGFPPEIKITLITLQSIGQQPSRRHLRSYQVPRVNKRTRALVPRRNGWPSPAPHGDPPMQGLPRGFQESVDLGFPDQVNSEGLDLARRTQSRHEATAEPRGATRTQLKAVPRVDDDDGACDYVS